MGREKVFVSVILLTNRYKIFLFFDFLEDEGVASSQPSEKFRDSHDE